MKVGEPKINNSTSGGAYSTTMSPMSGSSVEEQDLNVGDGDRNSDSEAFRPDCTFDEAQKPFVPLLIAAGLTLAFAHGANDVGNAIGPLTVLVGISREGSVSTDASVPILVLLLGAAAFAVGIITLGSRTIRTVGSQITELTPSRSFSTQIGAAVAVLFSSFLDLPVSTSHCLVGSKLVSPLLRGSAVYLAQILISPF